MATPSHTASKTSQVRGLSHLIQGLIGLNHADFNLAWSESMKLLNGLLAQSGHADRVRTQNLSQRGSKVVVVGAGGAEKLMQLEIDTSQLHPTRACSGHCRTLRLL